MSAMDLAQRTCSVNSTPFCSFPLCGSGAKAWVYTLPSWRCLPTCFRTQWPRNEPTVAVTTFPTFQPWSQVHNDSPFLNLIVPTKSASNNKRLSCLLRVSSIFVLSANQTIRYQKTGWSFLCLFFPTTWPRLTWGWVFGAA